MSKEYFEAKTKEDPYDEVIQVYGYRLLYENHFEENRHFFETTFENYRSTTSDYCEAIRNCGMDSLEFWTRTSTAASELQYWLYN